MRKQGGIQLLEKAVQAAIYEKALKNHYIEILYIDLKILMRYASGNIDDLNRIKQQMTMEAITQGTAEHIMHHVMINFILNGEMRFMQFDFTRESADTKNVFLFVEDYTVPQQQMMLLLEKKLVL